MNYNKPVIAALVLLLFWLQYQLWGGQGGLLSLWHLHHQVVAQKATDATLLKRNQQVAADVKNLKTGKQAVEEDARNNLGMIKRGEKFYRVVQ